ncbi:MAG: flagellar basal body P-ring protein FlgI [Pirellulaceae bacterium]|nr:flagellar basal body P-ring protein FlgI [Pirellulaceae bacterium]
MNLKRKHILTKPVLLVVIAIFLNFIPNVSRCQSLSKRGPVPEKSTGEFVDDGNTKYIGPATTFSGLDYAKLQAIGLIVDLQGTGSDPGPSWQRDKLVDDLKIRSKIDGPMNLLASPDTAMVKVTAMLPPGTRKGDRVDLLIESFEKDEVTSFNGGLMLTTSLRPWAVFGSSQVKSGNTMGTAEGYVLEDALFETRQDLSNRTNGIILGGGVSSENRVFLLNVKPEAQGLKAVADIQYALNHRFTVITADGRVGVAKAKTDRVIELLIPERYRENVGRFSQIIVNIAYDESANDRINRLELLEQQLADPSQARRAALRLEGIGKDGIAILKRALKNQELEVRFEAAMALAYQGEPDGLDVLTQAAEQDRAFRWHALAALQLLEDPRATDSLVHLLNSTSDEARYGAFRALKTRSPNHYLARSVVASKKFSAHVVPTNASPMVHLSRSKYPEVVIFGEEQLLHPNLLFVKTGLTVRGDGNGYVRIVRYSQGQKMERTVSNRTIDVVQGLAEVDCSYGTIVELFRNIRENQMMDAKLAINALPRPGRERDSSDWDSEVMLANYEEDAGQGRGNSATLSSKSGKLFGKATEEDQKKTPIFGKLGDMFSRSKQSP